MSRPVDPLTWIRTVLAYHAVGHIRASHFRVLVALGTHGDYDDGGSVRPGRDRLRALAGTSNRSIPEARSLGVELGLLEQTGKARRRGGDVPVFRLTRPADLPADVHAILGFRDPEDEPAQPCTNSAPTLHQTTLHPAPNNPAPCTTMVVHDPGPWDQGGGTPSAGAPGRPPPAQLARLIVATLSDLDAADRGTYVSQLIDNDGRRCAAHVQDYLLSSMSAPALHNAKNFVAGIDDQHQALVAEIVARWAR